MRLSGSAYSLGIETHNIGSRIINVYNREKCVVDAYKYLPEETAIKVLKTYLRQTDSDIPKLLEYSNLLRKPLHDVVRIIMTE